MTNRTTVERKSERELVATRVIDGPRELVFKAWTQADLFSRWWVPKSCPIALRSCELDVRVGGKYRLSFSAGDQTMDVFGKYIEVTPGARIAWTNDEGGEDKAAITTITLEERDGKTLLVMHDLHPSAQALDEAIASGSTDTTPETFEQLNALIVSLQGAAGSA